MKPLRDDGRADGPRVLFVAAPGTPARRLLRLARKAGADVEPAWLGAGAAPDVRRPDLDVVLVDAHDPATALSLLRDWRGDGATAPVMFVAADGDDVPRCIEGGADDCVTPAIDPKELGARLKALARRGRAWKPEVLEAYDLRIDTVRKRVARAGRPVELAPREYAILEYLALHRGRAVAQAEIWEKVFGEPGGRGGSNVLSVHVRELRRKIDGGFGVKLILTRYGFGYLLRQ